MITFLHQADSRAYLFNYSDVNNIEYLNSINTLLETTVKTQ